MASREHENLREYGNVKNIVDWEHGNIREPITAVGVLFSARNTVGGRKTAPRLSHAAVAGLAIPCADGLPADRRFHKCSCGIVFVLASR